MEIHLSKKPNAPIIIDGFPGLGLIATIAAEFLIKHLNAKSIGYFWSENLVPIVAVHNAMIMKPMEIFYDEKTNIIIVHAISDIRGMEWEIADAILELGRMLKAKEIISLEGVLSLSKDVNTYLLSPTKSRTKGYGKQTLQAFKEGMLVGITAALFLRSKEKKVTGIFVESHSKLPDSRSAAKLIEALDVYLGLKLDPKPLLEAAEQLEAKLRSIYEQAQEAIRHKQKKELTYVG